MSSDLALLVFFTHLLLALFLFSIKSGNQFSNKILAAYLSFIAVDISNFIFIDFYGAHLNLDMMRANIAALEAPTIYLYVKSVLNQQFRFSKKELIHLTPYLLVSAIFLPRFFLADEATKALFYNNQNPVPEVIAVHLILYVLMAIYLTKIFIVIRNYKLTILNNYSDQQLLNKQWLTRFMQVFLFNFAIITLRNVVKFTELQQILSIVTNLMMLITLVFVCWILWQALKKPELFNGLETDKESLAATSPDKKIEDSKANSVLTQLTTYMETKKPYLLPTLNIDTLAQHSELEVQDISLALNHHQGQHFFDFVNSYRIKSACQQLSDPECKNKTILDVLYDSGFNSKSSFNTAFKKHMKVTPSEFRKQALSEI